MSGRSSKNDPDGGADRLELALRASNEGIWDWLVKEGKISYSRRILEFLECSPAAAPNLFVPPHGPIHPDDLERFRAEVARAMENGGGDMLAMNCRVRTGSGEWRWLRIRGTVVRDRDGEAVRVAGSMIDISRRKEAEAQLQEERHLLRELIDNVPLQIYFKDMESRIVLANRQMAEWMGLDKPTDLAGKHDKDFFGPEHWRQAEEDERRIMETGVPVSGKLEREDWREGGETWVMTSKFPWRDRHGQTCGTFGVSSDVTELVKTQRKSAALAAELQARNRSYEEEVQLAREIQQAMVRAAFPDVRAHGIELGFSARYVPISGLAGDFFELLPISEGAVGMLICDVMGHGVRSALVVAMLRGLLERERMRAADPGALLRGLNDGLGAILRRAEVTLFATAFYAVVDLTEGTLRYACAGHPAAIAVGRRGAILLAAGHDEKGPALGLIDNATYPVGTVDLADVDRLMLYTDGLIEAVNKRGEAYQDTRAVRVVEEHRHAPVGELLDSIMEDVHAFTGVSQFEDDLCLLGMEVRRGDGGA